MSILNVIVRSAAEFVAVKAVASSPFIIGNPVMFVWYCLCVVLAFVLRLGMEYNNDRLTRKALLYQSICTIAWTFFSVICWDAVKKDSTEYFPIYLFINSLFATFLVSQLEDVGKVSLKQWFNSKVKSILATPNEEVKP